MAQLARFIRQDPRTALGRSSTRRGKGVARARADVEQRSNAAATPSTDLDNKASLVASLIEKKEASGKTFTEIGNELGLTNVYTAQLFFRQQRLSDETAPKLQKAVPGLTEQEVAEMKRAPMRSWDDDDMKEPNTYRLLEAVRTNAKAVKQLVNEELGDGIMSAIDFFMTVKKIEGKHGEKRALITFNGKFLPFLEQKQEDNTAE